MTEGKQVTLPVRVRKTISVKGVSWLNLRHGKDREGRCSAQRHSVRVKDGRGERGRDNLGARVEWGGEAQVQSHMDTV